MIIISHRGNINGPQPEHENKPAYIDAAIKLGYDVEIDLRTKDGKFYLGHDEPQYEVKTSWLIQRQIDLWVHCKDIETLEEALDLGLHCFWHDKDDYVITSERYVWSLSTSNTPEWHSIITVLPADNKDISNFSGVCTDYPMRYEN